MLCIIILSFQKLTTSWKLSCQVGKLTRDLSCPVWNGSCPVDILTKIQKKKKSWLYSDIIMGDSIWNHQPHNCLLSRLFRGRSKKTSKLHVTGLCVRNSRGPVNSPHKWPVTRKMFPFDDIIMINLIVFKFLWGSLDEEILLPCIWVLACFW